MNFSRYQNYPGIKYSGERFLLRNEVFTDNRNFPHSTPGIFAEAILIGKWGTQERNNLDDFRVFVLNQEIKRLVEALPQNYYTPHTKHPLPHTRWGFTTS